MIVSLPPVARERRLLLWGQDERPEDALAAGPGRRREPEHLGPEVVARGDLEASRARREHEESRAQRVEGPEAPAGPGQRRDEDVAGHREGLGLGLVGPVAVE